MTYKLKQKKIPKNYFEDLESRELREKYKGKLPPATELSRVGTRNTLHIGSLVHEKNNLVYYKDDLAKIKKVNKNGGIWIETYKRDKDDFLIPKKPIFIKEKDVEHKIYPVFYPQSSVGVIAPYNMATMTTYKD